ncbi:hypothetical protein ASZ90_009137 [hydrocarbon metagenome]|uniref:Uncharacterized protein n=1 Tax=hydrocarbon metagenome TaxID=938273 RepID=A0A0W8FJU9_9ZZZZ
MGRQRPVQGSPPPPLKRSPAQESISASAVAGPGCGTSARPTDEDLDTPPISSCGLNFP